MKRVNCVNSENERTRRVEEGRKRKSVKKREGEGRRVKTLYG